MRRDQKVVRPNRFPDRLELGSNPPVVNRDILGKVRQDIGERRPLRGLLSELKLVPAHHTAQEYVDAYL